eukprot:11363749-Karenia_brevis.AAC.1
MHGHLCATHAPKFENNVEVLLSDATRAAEHMVREGRLPAGLHNFVGAAKSRPKKKAKGNNDARRKEALESVNLCMKAMR